MGLWDIVLFNIAAVLGPRWIARAAHAGESSLSLWVLAAVLFFLPTSLIIVELSTRYPHEGGIYVWTKEAFGDFHGFAAGWSYWVYTLMYFPGLLQASAAMSVYLGGEKYSWLADNRYYILAGSIALLAVAAGMNLVGLNIGKWLQNAGGVGTYVPLMMLVGIAGWIGLRHGSPASIDWGKVIPSFKLADVGFWNFWSGIAFAFTGMELVCTMSEEVHEPRKTFPRSIFLSSALIAAIYILGTVAVLTLLPSGEVNNQNGVFQAIAKGSSLLGIAWFGVLAAGLVTFGNAGGVGATVAGVARVPFAVGIDRYLPDAFGRLHPKWGTPYIAIIVQAVLSALILLLSNLNETIKGAYEAIINVTIVVYFVPFLYMYASVIKLAYRADRKADEHVVLVPGGRLGVWIAGSLGFLITAVSIVLAFLPGPDVENVLFYEMKLVGGSVVSLGIGLGLYLMGKRHKSQA